MVFHELFIFLNSARYAYENCVGNSARAKCRKESAIFTRRLVELLSSERQFKNCAKIEDSLCSSGNRIENFFNFAFALFVAEKSLRGLLTKFMPINIWLNDKYF